MEKIGIYNEWVVDQLKEGQRDEQAIIPAIIIGYDVS